MEMNHLDITRIYKKGSSKLRGGLAVEDLVTSSIRKYPSPGFAVRGGLGGL
jgi:hypothetical protein